MNSISATLERWSAWAPGINSTALWQQWAEGTINFSDDINPDVSFLPAMFRRRLSTLSKMALLTAYECSRNESNQIRTVFCSRHGELTRTIGLLKDIAASELISPTGFSMAVHNTASGLFSIANQDTSITTAIAGGIDSFHSAFNDSAAALAAGESKKIMLVMADEPLPAPLEEFSDEQGIHFAAAFLFSCADNGPKVTLEMTDKTTENSPSTLPQALQFLRFLHNDTRQLQLNGERLCWRWSRDDL